MKELEINGYFTILENEILDFLPLIGLSKRELEFMIVAVRLLNGFNKKKDRIPLSQFYKLTGISKNNGSITVKKLIKRKMFYKNEGKIGINRDFSQWEGVLNLRTRKGLPIWIKKVLNSYDKKVLNLDPSKETSKETIQTKEDFYKKLSRKEIEKLEIENWYQAVMWNYGKFSKEYIESTIRGYDYNTRMSCWYIYVDSGKIRNKEAFFSHLLRNYQEDLKEGN